MEIGIGTCLGYMNGIVEINGKTIRKPLEDIMIENKIPIKLYKCWFNDGVMRSTFVNWTKSLLSKSISPVLLEHIPVKKWYIEEYGERKDVKLWDKNYYKWNQNIQKMADQYLDTVVVDTADKLAKICGQIQDPNLYIYYVLCPEMTYCGDAPVSAQYNENVIKQIKILREKCGDRLKIVRGWFFGSTQFERDIGGLERFIRDMRDQIELVDMIGVAFHNVVPDKDVALRMIACFERIRKSTDRPLMVPYSYIRWDPMDAKSDSNAAEFWTTIHDNEKKLVDMGVRSWVLSATLEERSDGTGLVDRLVPIGGYRYPLKLSKGGDAFINI
jgi:hypothetical protein